MTDNSNLLNNRQGITSDCFYNMKPSAVRSKSMRCSVLPTNKSTFLPGDVCVSYIPCGRKNTFLDCSQTYARITVSNNDTINTIGLDCTASSFINRIDVFHSSNLLETISAYNVLFQYLVDFSTTGSFLDGSVSWGNVSGTRAGLVIPHAVSATLAKQATFCVPIVSGVFGTLCEKNCIWCTSIEYIFKISWDVIIYA